MQSYLLGLFREGDEPRDAQKYSTSSTYNYYKELTSVPVNPLLLKSSSKQIISVPSKQRQNRFKDVSTAGIPIIPPFPPIGLSFFSLNSSLIHSHFTRWNEYRARQLARVQFTLIYQSQNNIGKHRGSGINFRQKKKKWEKDECHAPATMFN